jgi:hypothetical protein
MSPLLYLYIFKKKSDWVVYNITSKLKARSIQPGRSTPPGVLPSPGFVVCHQDIMSVLYLLWWLPLMVVTYIFIGLERVSSSAVAAPHTQGLHVGPRRKNKPRDNQDYVLKKGRRRRRWRRPFFYWPAALFWVYFKLKNRNNKKKGF